MDKQRMDVDRGLYIG